MKVKSLFVKSGAEFSACGKYRYDLWREWNPKQPTVLFVMLNPSTATETENDPTVERCQRRAVAMGFGRIHVANIFAWRSTDPEQLYYVSNPVGWDNDQAIVKATLAAQLVICGWGQHGKHLNRGERVLELIRSTSATPFALKINADKTPAHPLYLGYNLKPFPMEE